MIKQGIKNYLKNLKYVFTPLGAIALGVVIGLSISIPIIVNSLSDLANVIIEISQNTQIRVQDLIDAIVDRVNSLNWGNPIKAFKILLDTDWLTETLSNCIESISVDVSQLEGYVNNCVDDLSMAFGVFATFVILGFIGGYFLTKCLIRHEIASRALWKYFLISFIDSVLSATLVTLCLWILTLWKLGVIISSFLSMMLFGSIQLFEAYIAHAWKKVDLKKVINVKNIAKLYLSDVLIFLLATAFTGIVIAITNVLGGLFVGIALIEIAFIVIGLNAEAYVKSITVTVNTNIPVEKLQAVENSQEEIQAEVKENPDIK